MSCYFVHKTDGVYNGYMVNVDTTVTRDEHGSEASHIFFLNRNSLKAGILMGLQLNSVKNKLLFALNVLLVEGLLSSCTEV